MAQIAISGEWFANLSRYMDQLQADTNAAAENAVSYLKDRITEKAREIPEWSGLADQITTWSQDGQFFIGVNNVDFASQAMALEYGDETRPPSALFRTVAEDVNEASRRWQEEMESKGYTYGQKFVGMQ